MIWTLRILKNFKGRMYWESFWIPVKWRWSFLFIGIWWELLYWQSDPQLVRGSNNSYFAGRAILRYPASIIVVMITKDCIRTRARLCLSIVFDGPVPWAWFQMAYGPIWVILIPTTYNVCCEPKNYTFYHIFLR